ncbi:hypothetical protein Cni_G28714 [Canna indica]|uniref:Uncharacterized protein n=1 Tax=Canna indica TaxID=4628 RepID=A0AAQ3L5Z5_9LILI|nr:hypothetical protein Cni_G28714 [Canna indica]
MVYTPAPSPSKKATESKGGRETHTMSAKKRRDLDNAQRNNHSGSSDDYSVFSPQGVESENALKHKQELSMLREQVNDLPSTILEKDEALKSAENKIIQMKAASVSVDELRLQIAEKDSLVKSINSQLNNVKQAALERLTWEAQMSKQKIEEFEEQIVSMDYGVAELIYESLCSNDSVVQPDESLILYDLEPLLVTNNMDDFEIEKMEEARSTYLAAVAAAKGNPTEELLASAAEARSRLQALVF